MLEQWGASKDHVGTELITLGWEPEQLFTLYTSKPRHYNTRFLSEFVNRGRFFTNTILYSNLITFSVIFEHNNQLVNKIELYV